MEKERAKCLISGLKRFKLTEVETQIVFLAETNLTQNGKLDERMELIVELIYGQKTTFIRNALFSTLTPKQKYRYLYKKMSTPLVWGLA